MRIIPAIDIIKGKCVRLTKGNYDTQIVYNEDPLEVAKQFQDHGIKYLHMVDLDGARSNKIINYKVLERVASKTDLIIDFGGGLKSNQDIKIAFNSGASQITGGSIAVKQPDIFYNWLVEYGKDKIILGADTINTKIAIEGWFEESDQEIIPFIQQYENKGIKYVISTDISKDGMLQGPSFDLYKKIIKKTPKVNIIASGGITSINDIVNLTQIGCEGAIIGKAIYEKKINLKQLEEFV
jgi:phosphoribosylformimino-5-aminoimidazole carboxamide ribotide isomerase